jgi:hypothetical protein
MAGGAIACKEFGAAEIQWSEGLRQGDARRRCRGQREAADESRIHKVSQNFHVSL